MTHLYCTCDWLLMIGADDKIVTDSPAIILKNGLTGGNGSKDKGIALALDQRSKALAVTSYTEPEKDRLFETYTLLTI